MSKRIFIPLEQTLPILLRLAELGFDIVLRPVRDLDGVAFMNCVLTPPPDVDVRGPYYLASDDDEPRARGYVFDLSPGSTNPGERWRFLYLVVPRGDRPAVLRWDRPGWIPEQI